MMPLTFNEFYNERTGLTVGINKVLFSEETPYQKVEVFDTDTWGNMMVIDGMVMLSQKDEFVYHEMLTHAGMFSHPNPERVLIIGGGDGGTAREVLRHPTLEQVDLVEIDEAVVRASKQFLPEVGNWNDHRLNVIFEDGIKFVQEIKSPYDVIFVDGSDPVGPAEGLFEREFIQACYHGLTDDGILVVQSESPWISEYHKSMNQIFMTLENIYERSMIYLAYIPLYPTGMWSFSFASKGADPLSEETLDCVESGLQQFGSALKYYNADIHKSCFALPNFVADILH